GRQGDVALFDVFRANGQVDTLFDQPSVLPMETYLLGLIADGHLPFEEYLHFHDEQVRRAYYMFTASEQALTRANRAFQSKLVQLEAANRVLTQRTDALISLHDLSLALVGSTGLEDLAARICKHARDLCGAERVILYYEHTPDETEVLGVSGWDPDLVHLQVPTGDVFAGVTSAEPQPHRSPGRPPPGLDLKPLQVDMLRAGLSVPLLAQDRRVGLMVVHSLTKSRFQPGEVSLLQTLASQAALALQRAGLIEELRQKIAALEEAQSELVQKERLEQEMALARQVQQSVLPRTFPEIAGYGFAAVNEPARQVGGDFYDVIDLGEGFFGVAIADVSDKGMPAALYMALTRSLLRAEARRDRSPAAVVRQVNQLLLELAEPDMFVTLFYAVVDAAARQMTYTRAGHDRPVLLRAGQAIELGGQGAALGLVDDLRLTEEQVQLQSGDRLVLFTDGLVDVVSPEGELADRSNLADLLLRCAALPPKDLCAAVFTALESYRGTAEQYDDMTILAVGVA
ncbi:MAG TPA: GAF domain-containing SpoIIE family protein phosphatase, partial [Anaerolineaceae bacterium]|nr:GAF domain-containing SpoIIE family protein phosphatase [Anaerolineaceae bacterium]